MANEIQQAELNAEGDLVGRDFRLGLRTGAWSRKKRSFGFGCGWVLLIVSICTGFGFLPVLLGSPAALLLVVFGGLIAAAVMMIARSGSWYERLFRYEQGVAQFADKAPEPTVLRWDSLASLSLHVVTSYESHSLASCVLRDTAGQTITVDSGYGTACDVITATAEQVLSSRLVPTLIARYDAGEPVTFGQIVVDRTGISRPGGGSGKPWSAFWRDTRSVEMEMHGHRMTIKPHSGSARSVSLDGAPNDFLAVYVIAHAAGQAGVVASAH